MKILIAPLVIAQIMWFSTAAFAEEPDAKSIPKPILMLGLFCNSALFAMKSSFETNPAALPWLATGAKVDEIKSLMNKIDATDAPYEKAIRDHAITEDEAKFLKFSALHEAEQWIKNINQSCATPNHTPQVYEACLKETNSEIYKCYRHIIDSMQAIGKSSSDK